LRKERTAFLINFFLPGGGFVYLGRFGLALLNFALLFIVGPLVKYALGDLYDLLGVFYVIAVMTASGVWAQHVAREMNALK